MRRFSRLLASFLAFALLLGLAPGALPQAEAYSPAFSTIRIGLNAHRSWQPTPSLQLNNASGLRLGTYNAQREFVPAGQQTHQQLNIVASGGVLTVTNPQGTVIATGQTLTIAPVNLDVTTTYTVPHLRYGGNIRTNFEFFGGFRMNASGNTMTVVNYVDLENYLKGVVPYESIPSWPAAALEAQAITARTFAVRNFGRNGAHGFDLSNSTFDQVYRGMHGATVATNEAVRNTAGVFIMHNGRPIEAVYHSASGGATEDSVNVWGGSVPYLIGVDDSRETRPEGMEWSRVLTATELFNHMRRGGRNFPLSDIADVETELTPNGNMLRITFIASNGQRHSYHRSAARTAVNSGLHPVFNSQRFTVTRNDVTPQGMLAPLAASSWELEVVEFDQWEEEQGDLFKYHTELELIELFATGQIPMHTASYAAISALNAGQPTFTIRNYGFGHGVGMSQHGSAALARLGYTAEQIILHYYTGVTLSNRTDNQTPPPPPPPPPPVGFTDVAPGAWYYAPANYVREHGLMNGTSLTEFSPHMTATRGMFVTILGRMAEINTLDYAPRGTVQIAPGTSLNIRAGAGAQHPIVGTLASGASVTIIGSSGDWLRIAHGNTTNAFVSRQHIAVNNRFTDVAPGAFYAPYVEWAYQNGITSGTGDGGFSPSRNLTRQEMATLLHGYIQTMGIQLAQDTSLPDFTDIDLVAAWARPAIVALQRANIIQGTGDGSFNPQGTTTRASVASMIRNFHMQYVQ